MANLFDIANLITTVGVEAVKIKQEPGLPEKSSNEILTELFSTFDADEGIASPAEDDNGEPEEQGDKAVDPDANDKSSITSKSHGKKKKKSKKKHKHKDKKHKKKGKHNSSASESEGADDGTKNKKKHKKKSKRKHESRSSQGSDSEGPNAKKIKTEVTPSDECKAKPEDKEQEAASIVTKDVDKDSKDGSKETKSPDSPKLPPISRKRNEEDDDDEQGPGIPRFIENQKKSFQGKILIKDLKNSAVYSETVKEIEIKEKEKAARMEDGEISDSSSYNRTPTLSPTPPPDDSLIDSPTRSPLSYSKRNRTLSPGPTGMIKTDLRLILKEKEKKKYSMAKKTDAHDNKDPRNKGNRDYHYKDSRYKGNERSRRSQSRERKGLEPLIHSTHYRSRSGGRESRRRSGERRDRDRSSDKRMERSRESRKYGKDDSDGHRSRSEDRYRDKHMRPRSRSKERKERIEIDKKKLLEIARRNAINMIKQGALPLAQQDKAIAAIQAGGKTVDELTDFCKSLSKSEALGELSSISSDDDGNESEKGFHHPFVLRERPTSIIMNIKDAKQLPNKTFQEKTAESSTQLRLQFPVSSGQHHRKTEIEWIPVVPKKPEPKKTFVPAVTPVKPQTFGISPPISATVPPVQMSIQQPVPMLSVPPTPMQIPIQPQPPVFPQAPPVEAVDIGSIVSQRLAAMRRLRENPNDVEALTEMHHAQNGMKNWAESKQMPGQFTGSTGVKVLSPAELHSGYQAWARKDQLVTATPVSGGMGMALLQKMGWRPGEGLGKNKEGTLVPLQLEVKLDKRGLISDQDIGHRSGKSQRPAVPMIKTLEGKHPVSLLGEYCSKRKLGAPVYELCFECGPDHKKNFLFKVKVNGIEYKPTVASPNKKQAKAEAAQICLQTLGLLPS